MVAISLVVLYLEVSGGGCGSYLSCGSIFRSGWRPHSHVISRTMAHIRCAVRFLLLGNCYQAVSRLSSPKTGWWSSPVHCYQVLSDALTHSP